MTAGSDAAQWYGNLIAIAATILCVIALVVSVVSARFSQRQARAAEQAALTNTHSVQIQAEALKNQSEQTLTALQIADPNAIAAEESAEYSKWENRRQARNDEKLGKFWNVNPLFEPLSRAGEQG
jgi:hypothetical protein